MVKFGLILVALVGCISAVSPATDRISLDKVVSDNVAINVADLKVYTGPAIDPEDNQLGNSRLATNPLSGGLIQLLKDLFVPTLLQDFYKLFVLNPPKKLNKQRVFKHGTIEETKKYLALSLLSVCTKDDVLGQSCGCQKALTDITVIENKDFKSLVVTGADTVNKFIVVSYRATLLVQNWITDFSYPKVDYPYLPEGIRVHHGFLSHYLSSYHEVENAVKKLLANPKYKDYTLHITGYSLGAGISTISLPNWAKLLKDSNDNRPLQNYAYASPRVGNDDFVQYLYSLNIPITRYTNVNDIVPHLPPRSGDFVHAGGEIHERKTGILGITELVVCGQGTYDENPECGWKDKAPVSLLRHIFPMNRLAIDTFCI